MSSLKPFVNDNRLWNAFLEELEIEISREQRTLEQLSEPNDIYRSQGKIMALRKLMKLRDKVNDG